MDYKLLIPKIFDEIKRDPVNIQPLKDLFSICRHIEAENFKHSHLTNKLLRNCITQALGICRINSVIALPFKGINGVLGWLKDLDILGIQPFSGIKTISIPQIPLIPYKDGGFPSVGEIFVANEAGPEMVGTIGNRTAVANTDQIITGISEGVSDANAEQNALLREQNALLRKLLEKDTVVNNVIGTNDIINGLQRKNRRDGKTVVPVSG